MAGEETPKSIEPVTKEDSPMTEDLAKEEITHSEKDLPITDEACTRVMIAVNQCSKGYPKPSISSRAAFDWIVKNLIKPCCKKRYKLLILHVQVLDEDGLKELDSVYASPSDFQHLRHEERAKGASLIQYFIQKCHDSEVLILEDIMLSLLANSLASIISIQKELQIECEGWIKMGDPKAVVCEEVKKKNPDMLVLGSRGLGTIQRMFVAGVSSYVTKHVDCPVIVIKRDPKDIPDDPMND